MKERQVLEAYRHIGDTVYYAIFAIPGKEPRLRSDKIHYIEALPSRINFMRKDGTLICSADVVGKWNEDFFVSFSSSEVEKEIEKREGVQNPLKDLLKKGRKGEKQMEERQILEAYRHIGDTVYYAIFNIPGEEPRLESDKIHYIEVSTSGIDFLDEYGDFICSAETVGKWRGDIFSSFSSSEVEKEIEKRRGFF